MAKKEITLTSESVRKAYINEFLKRKTEAESFASFTEVELTAFIRKYESATFPTVYECLDHNFYDRMRNRIATNREMAAIDEEAELMYSIHLKTYSQFLQSKAFTNLLKHKTNPEGRVRKSQPQQQAKIPPFREETEGERMHITKEMDVIRRNPQLRRQCIDRYGYQCQCCGMDFVEMYGEALGADFIEVHHLKPISSFETEGIPKDFVENLVPLCSNCHSMIHRIEQSKHPLRDLREAYRGTKKELRVLKED